MNVAKLMLNSRLMGGRIKNTCRSILVPSCPPAKPHFLYRPIEIPPLSPADHLQAPNCPPEICLQKDQEAQGAVAPTVSISTLHSSAFLLY